MSKEHIDAMSVISLWFEDNENKILRYFEDHAWLPADIRKLRAFQREADIETLAITRTMIYGLTHDRTVVITGRGNLGIGDNFY